MRAEPLTGANAERSLRDLDRLARRERRRRYRELSMAERLESSIELSELARELRAGMLKASR